MAQAAPPQHVDLVATPAWKGWSRPGRATEVDIRLTTERTMRVPLDVVAGNQAVHADLELQTGRVLRVQIPVGSAERVVVGIAMSGGVPVRRELDIALSESPLLAVGLSTGEPVQLEGFHTLSLTGDDLPRNALAYSSIDALILDASTLNELDQRQLEALLAHIAGCGRLVVLNTELPVRRLLFGVAGCGGRALMSATSLTQAKQMLESSLALDLTTAMTPAGLGELTRPARVIWNRVTVALAVYFAATLLALMFFSALPVVLLTPMLAAAAALALLHGMQPLSQLLVWSEGESGAQVARYQAWQRFSGLVRERMRVPIPPQLASAVQPCEPTQAMRFDYETSSGRVTFAEFDTRLFRQVALCYSGSFPMARALSVEARADGARELQNVGIKAWPRGVLLAEGLAQELPALGPGAGISIGAGTGNPPRDAVVRTAMARTPPDRVAALWELELRGVVDASIESQGWLLVLAAAP